MYKFVTHEWLNVTNDFYFILYKFLLIFIFSFIRIFIFIRFIDAA